MSEPLAAGVEIAPGYRVLELLRRSSAVDVYDVWSEQRQCRCIAKVLGPERSCEPKARRRLAREGRLLKRLSHPHLVRAYEILYRPAPLVILETLTGATLAHLIHESQAGLALTDVSIMGTHVCSALHYLHAQGILHLDLKPSNIIASGGLAKVLDLDIARRPGRSRGEGTRQYMSPEQARRELLTEKSDVWSLGVVLFEAATRRLPFDFERDAHFPQIEVRAARVCRIKRSVPRDLACAIDAALEPDPADRPTLDDLARQLGGYITGKVS